MSNINNQSFAHCNEDARRLKYHITILLIVSNLATLEAKVQEVLVLDTLPRSIKIDARGQATLAKGFDHKHLPDENTEINLEDQASNIYPTKYLVHRRALSGGWKAFFIDHKLVPGDVLVFQLVLPTKFKTLAKGFGRKHLPDENNEINLEDQAGNIYPTKYLVHRRALSGGWKAFSIDHKLVPRDVLVFQLVQPTKFKTFAKGFGRKHLPDENNEINLEDQAGNIYPPKYLVHRRTLSGGRKAFSIDHKFDRKHLPDENTEINLEDQAGNIYPTKYLVHRRALSENLPDGSERRESGNGEKDGGFGFSISDGIRMCEPAVIDFKQVKSFDDFDIVANGIVINCELSKQLQLKYYELCSSQKLFLRERILNSLNCKLIVGVIAETINIADAIRDSKFGGAANTQQKEDFVTWENTLVAFEKLGMNVGFILTRLRQLMGRCDSANRDKRLRAERVQVEDETLAKGFDRKHLPDENTEINLEDQAGNIYPTKKPHVLIVLVHAENLPDGSERRESGDGEKDGGFGFSISDGIRMCEPAAIDFKQVKSFDDFDIVANDIVINYAIRDSKFGGAANTQQKEDFVTWENTLVAFEKLGMNVGFILTRLRQLMGRCYGANRDKRLRAERVQVEDEVKILKAKLEEAMERIRRIDGEMEGDEVDVEVKFREVAKATWSLVTCSGKESC
ncbi:B3 domain-containing protein Os01g0234100 [Linum perenne]